MQIFFAAGIHDCAFTLTLIFNVQSNAITHHAREIKTHLLANAFFLQQYSKQQIARYAETFTIFVMDGVEITRDQFGKVASLLASKLKLVLLI
ncbi:Uncharacterised protein [Vibrio cholerae]|uniref:Uncharacterized protein n=1 Tax=Vibrio cholerae TaxID=666 RepID=A0A655UPR7_VIBCL|nr:Uncharacterised protein [Vibrio cholerae]